MKRLAVFFLASLFLCSCGVAEKKVVSEHIRYVTNATPKQKLVIDEALAWLAPDVQKSVIAIEINNNAIHFLSTVVDGGFAAAHLCPYNMEKICIRPEFLDADLIWHEAGHTHFFKKENSEEQKSI